jgi:DNA gyrase subunit A
MMKPSRPDLSQVDPTVRSYIEALETELEGLRNGASRRAPRVAAGAEEDRADHLPEIAEPSEPATTINIITATATGLAKRTPRHLYARQRRGGMGIFDIETPEDAPPAILSMADEDQSLLLLTRMGRAFRLPAALVTETPVRGRGQSIVAKLDLPADDGLAAILPEQAQGYMALISQSGMVRMLRHHVFGEYMKPGAAMYDYRLFGPLAAASWTSGDGDLFVATRQGRAIRFSERLVPPAGVRAIRLADDDVVIGITPVYDDIGVFMLAADGRGTIRSMEGFSPNKTPGAGGKIAMNNDSLVCAISIDDKTDALVISRLSKIIRFPLEDVPAKDAPVQGVNCMALRADEPVAVILA